MIEVEILGIPLKFETVPGLFSPDRLDRGTLAMLSVAEGIPGSKVLDLGCGYGVVGIFCARTGAKEVVMSDIDPAAVSCAAGNAVLNGVVNARGVVSGDYGAVPDADFDLILSNPPYHVDFSVPKRFIEGGFRRLKPGGRMVMVTKRKEWYKRKFISVFGGVKIAEQDGYFIFMAEKRLKRGGSPGQAGDRPPPSGREKQV